MILLFPSRNDVRQVNEGLPVSLQVATMAQEILYQNWGFSLGRYRSNIPNAGQGVHVVKGCIKAGQITSLYPGMSVGSTYCSCVSHLRFELVSSSQTVRPYFQIQYIHDPNDTETKFQL